MHAAHMYMYMMTATEPQMRPRKSTKREVAGGRTTADEDEAEWCQPQLQLHARVHDV